MVGMLYLSERAAIRGELLIATLRRHVETRTEHVCGTTVRAPNDCTPVVNPSNLTAYDCTELIVCIRARLDALAHVVPSHFAVIRMDQF